MRHNVLVYKLQPATTIKSANHMEWCILSIHPHENKNWDITFSFVWPTENIIQFRVMNILVLILLNKSLELYSWHVTCILILACQHKVDDFKGKRVSWWCSVFPTPHAHKLYIIMHAIYTKCTQNYIICTKIIQNNCSNYFIIFNFCC